MGFEIENGVLKKYTQEPGVTEVVIPNKVKRIESRAFELCKRLTSVIIPDSVTSIEKSAFLGCSKLTSMVIPNSVTSIAERVFYECKKLKSVTISDSLTSIGDEAFSYCSSLTSVTIPDSVTSIGDRAFWGCESLTSVTIPDSVTSIGWGAFYWCESLTSVTIPDSVTSIGDGAFCGCKALADDEGFVIIRNVLYSYRGNDSEVIIPDSVTSIGYKAFWYCNSLTSVTIGNSVTSIGDSAFSSCYSLTSVTIPDSVTSIGESAFSYCSRLTTVTIPDSVTSIEKSAFFGCERLTAITIPDSVMSIGEYAFYSCKRLTSVTIPDSVKSIGRDAFAECRSLTIFFSGSLSNIDGDIPADKIRVSDDTIRSGEKIDPKLAPNINDPNNEILSYLLVYQTVKSWKQHLFDIVQYKDTQAVFMLILDRLREMKKIPAASAAQVLEYAKMFINELSSENINELYVVFTEKKCKKQLKEMDEDTNIQRKMNSSEDGFVVEKTFYEIFIQEHNIRTIRIKEEIKNFGITVNDVPALTDKEGKEIPKAIAAWLLTVHGSDFGADYNSDYSEEYYDYSMIGGYQKPGICPEAEEIVSRIAPDALQEFILTFFGYLGSKGVSKKMFLAYPMCRYADEKTMAYLTSQAPKWSSKVSGDDAPPLLSFRQACLYSNTRSAMLFAERYHELDKYAKLRGMDEDTFRDMYLSDIGLDTQGGKEYDLGNQTVTARLQKDLTFLFELPNGKTAKSLPKKGADTDKYEAAKKDFDEMKKAAKKILKSRGNVLFEDFLSGNARKSQAWKGAYISNPLLRNIAKIVVWSQGNSTFVLTDSEAIGCNGEKYTITDEEIKIAHPMEMDKAEVSAWQKYFADNDLKQPFAQVWEPVRDPAQVKENRYDGCRLEVYQFSGKDKHGIHAYGVYAFSEDFGFELDDCKLGYECDTCRLDEIKGVYYTLGKFSFKKFTRKVNHIITILDKMTVSDRILKDDVSVVEQMNSFTVAQIIEFISMAQEAGAVNVTAALLEYRNNTYPDYNVMDEFVLDW